MNTLYTHTTPTDRKKGNYKFGQTNRTADVRIKEQARTAMSENPEKVWEGISEFSDHDIHRKLVKMGYIHIVREWYGGFRSDDEVIVVMNKIIAESSQDTRIEYNPRYYQSVIKNQFLAKYLEELHLNYGKIDFALELAPRFGKTIWAIDLLNTLFLEYNIKFCVIPSYVLTAITSFKK